MPEKDNKLQVSFRIHNQLVAESEKLRLEMETPLNEIQFIVSLISRGHSIRKKLNDYFLTDFHAKSVELAEKADKEFNQQYLNIPTAQSTRFQYRTKSVWLTYQDTKTINNMLYLGIQFERGLI